MSNELFAVSVVCDYDDVRIHVSIHQGYEAAKSRAVELCASGDFCRAEHRVFVSPVTLGADLCDMLAEGVEEILDL
jgi:hypothetical protein